MRLPTLAAAMVGAALLICSQICSAADLDIVGGTPSELSVRLLRAQPDHLYRLTYDDGRHRFVWENLSPGEDRIVRLADDHHLRPEYRLGCESQTGPGDPVVFDDLVKAPIAGNRRLRFGVPVSTFGGPGYLVPGLSDLKRDDFGNFWLYLDRPPYAVLKYDSACEYQFALLAPGPVLAHDLDAQGNLYLLHPDNWISKHGPLGNPLAAWEVPVGRDAGEFISASGMAIDRTAGMIYIADETLGRVQRFDLDLVLRPFLHSPWGWIGREDLAHMRPGEYDRVRMYYHLDRPRQLCLDGRGHLFVSCEHYISKFSLATGQQVDFGANPVLGWGGTFTDSPFSRSAALDGHWQRHWLAGVDTFGNIYVADRGNEFVVDPRLQVFGPDGVLLNPYDIETELRTAGGRRAYITAVRGIASSSDRVWLGDAAGRIYEGPPGGGLRGGGRLLLGPGAAGRQFDLTRAEAQHFRVEAQSDRVAHRSQGMILAYPGGEGGTGNCERQGRPVLDPGKTSMWAPARLGEPFHVVLFRADGTAIPPAEYEVELEEKPGLFGTRYDFFRVTNHSARTWRDVRFVAEAVD